MRYRLAALASILLLAPSLTSAQFSGTAASIGQDPFTITITPVYPEPNGTAALTLLSDSLDLTNASLVVTVGGKSIYEGSVRAVELPLGRAGALVSAVITVITNGRKYTQTLGVRPQDVTVIAEPLASVPPLYPGKPNVPLEGDVRVVAVANLRTAAGKALDPAALSYAWSVDGVQIANSSGIGKSAIVAASPLQYRNRDVSVIVRSADGTLVGGDTISLSPREPTVRIYENDPLLGIRYERALLGRFTIGGAETTLYGAPFSFPLAGGAPTLVWSLDGATAQTGGSITLRPTGSGGGTALLSLMASGAGYTTAKSDLSLTFGKSGGSNFFGL